MKHNFWTIFFALWLISVYGQSPRTTKQTDKASSNKTNTPVDIPPPPSGSHLGEPIAQIKTAIQETSSKTNPHNPYYDWFWPPVWSTWAAVIAAGLAACAGFKTLKAMNRQTKILINQTRAIRTQASANVVSAEAATDSARTAKRTLEISQRASVWIEAVKLKNTAPRAITEIPSNSNIALSRIEISLINAGNTVAKGVRCKVLIICQELEGTQAFGPREFEFGPTIIPPHKEYRPHTPELIQVFPDCTHEAVLNNLVRLKRLVVTVRIVYGDVFGTSIASSYQATISEREDALTYNFEIRSEIEGE